MKKTLEGLLRGIIKIPGCPGCRILKSLMLCKSIAQSECRVCGTEWKRDGKKLFKRTHESNAVAQ